MWIPSNQLLSSGAKTLGGDTVATTVNLKAPILALLRAPHDFTPDTVYGDVSAKLANFQGYAPQAIASWTGPQEVQGGFWALIAPAKVFSATGDDTVNTIYGQILLGSDTVTYLAGEAFDAPVPLPASGSSLVSVVIFGLGPNAAGYGKSIVSN